MNGLKQLLVLVLISPILPAIGLLHLVRAIAPEDPRTSTEKNDSRVKELPARHRSERRREGGRYLVSGSHRA